VEAVSVWIAEEASVWNSGFTADDLEPVLRVRVDLPGPFGIRFRGRFFPAETYPRAQEAWLGHLEGLPASASWHSGVRGQYRSSQVGESTCQA
jgi:hypothetical protein